MRFFRRSSRRRPRSRRLGRSRGSRWTLLVAAVAVGAVAFSVSRRRGGSTPAPVTTPTGGPGRHVDPVSEADWLDQHRDVVAAPGAAPPSADPEVPTADALDQAALVGPSEIVDPPSRDPEVPEADAL
jgi:hypothetical protein